MDNPKLAKAVAWLLPENILKQYASSLENVLAYNKDMQWTPAYQVLAFECHKAFLDMDLQCSAIGASSGGYSECSYSLGDKKFVGFGVTCEDCIFDAVMDAYDKRDKSGE